MSGYPKWLFSGYFPDIRTAVSNEMPALKSLEKFDSLSSWTFSANQKMGAHHFPES